MRVQIVRGTTRTVLKTGTVGSHEEEEWFILAGTMRSVAQASAPNGWDVAPVGGRNDQLIITAPEGAMQGQYLAHWKGTTKPKPCIIAAFEVV
jgi:hypothetical protein